MEGRSRWSCRAERARSSSGRAAVTGRAHLPIRSLARLEQERARAAIRRIFDHLAAAGDEPEQIVDFIAGMTDRFALTYVAELGV